MPLLNAVRRHPLLSGIVVFVATPLLLFTIWTSIALSYSYSTAESAGFLQKFSKRGWLCKTWEGELQLVSLPGTAPERFDFTARSDSVAAQLDKLAGQRVVVTYDQHKGVPGSCFGETENFVTAVRLVGPQ